MKRFSNAILSFAVFGSIILGVAANADAQRRSEREVRDAVSTLRSQMDDLQYDLEAAAQNNRGPAFNDVERGVNNLKDKVDAFDENVSQRRENRDDVNEIVTAAKDVEAALRVANLNRSLQTNWSGVKRSIDSLAQKYGVTPDWNGRVSSVPPTPRMSTPVRASAPGLTGTYRLDTAKSESIADILSSANVASGQRQDLESKLEAPAEIALLVSGNQVTLASSKAAPVTVVADGREKTDTTSGRTIRMRTTLRGQELTVSSLGGETDYTVTFVSVDGGNSLKVTRRITTDYLKETIFAESIYTKTDAVAGLGIDNNGVPTDSDAGTYSTNDPADRDPQYGGTPSVVTPRIGEFVVPNGTSVAAVLDNPIDTKVSQNNDRFRMTVQSPDEYRGAIIEGYISGVGRSGQVSGRSNVTFNFTKITLRDGKAYDFAGTLQGIKDAYGKDVKIDAEGTAKGESQTKETAKRGGIGAGAGALIGAIIGGGKGAVVGAIIGGGAGAGSVIVQGRDDIKLQQGSVITVISSSPIRRDQQISENN